MLKSDFRSPLSPCSSIRLQREKLDLEIVGLKQKILDGKRKIKSIERMLEDAQMQVIEKTAMARELKDKEAEQLLSDIENKRILLKELGPKARKSSLSPRKQSSSHRSFRFDDKGIMMSQESMMTAAKRGTFDTAFEDVVGCNPQVIVAEIAPPKIASPSANNKSISSETLRKSNVSSRGAATDRRGGGRGSDNLLDEVVSDSFGGHHHHHHHHHLNAHAEAKEDENDENADEHFSQNSLVAEEDAMHQAQLSAQLEYHVDGYKSEDESLGEDFARFFSSFVCTPTNRQASAAVANVKQMTSK